MDLTKAPLTLSEREGLTRWMDPEYAPNQPTVIATRELLRRLLQCCIDADNEAEEAHQVGVRDGYEKAVQDLDIATGGDGEYVFSTISGAGCPDAEAMKARIVGRLDRSGFIRGAQACRGMIASFIENGGDPTMAESVRANWSPSWGDDPGEPLTDAGRAALEQGS